MRERDRKRQKSICPGKSYLYGNEVVLALRKVPAASPRSTMSQWKVRFPDGRVEHVSAAQLHTVQKDRYTKAAMAAIGAEIERRRRVQGIPVFFVGYLRERYVPRAKVKFGKLLP